MNILRSSLLTGLLALATSSLSHAQLVTNGGFETSDFTGWTESGNLSATGVDTFSHSGRFGAYLGAVGSLHFLSQTVATTVGSSYNLEFWLYSDGRTPNQFTVSVDSNVLFNSSNLPAFDWTYYSYDFTAASSSTVLTFGSRNDPAYLHLDDIAIQSTSSAVPEPSTYGLIGGAALLGLVVVRRRRR